MAREACIVGGACMAGGGGVTCMPGGSGWHAWQGVVCGRGGGCVA